MVLADGKAETGGVLDVLVLHLLRCIDGKFHGVTRAADGAAGGIGHISDDVECALLTVTALYKRNLRAGDHDGDGDEVVRLVEAEVESLQIDADVGGGQVAR